MEQKGMQEAAAFIRQKGLLRTGDRVLAACSGGVDSVTMLHYLAEQRTRLGIEVGAVHVDHCLRGEESALDGETVRQLAGQLGVMCYLTSVPVPDLIRQSGGNVQEVCRTGRYAKFEEVMADGQFNVLAVAHHAEDQLETVLMQLAKGQLPKGMPTVRPLGSGRLVRPFLPVVKQDLYRYAEKHGLAYREDPSNAKDAYTRNRYRRHVVPALLAEEPAAAVQAVRMAEALQEEDDFLRETAAEKAEQLIGSGSTQGRLTVRSETFRAMHPALQKRVVPLLLKYLYDGETVPASFNASLVDQIVRQLCEVRGSASVHLPEGWRLRREYGVSSFVRTAERQPGRSVPFPKNEWVVWGEDRLRWCLAGQADPAELASVSEWRYFQPAQEGLPCLIRTRRPGDRIRLAGMAQPKKLNRLLIDEKVERSKRDGLPVVVSEKGGICAVPGVRYGEWFTRRPPAGEAYILMLDRADRQCPPAVR